MCVVEGTCTIWGTKGVSTWRRFFQHCLISVSTLKSTSHTTSQSVCECVSECVCAGTVFAYGQTGSGKTYTMTGERGDPGVIPNSFEHIFSHISQSQDEQYLVRVSYLEIYKV